MDKYALHAITSEDISHSAGHNVKQRQCLCVVSDGDISETYGSLISSTLAVNQGHSPVSERAFPCRQY